MGTAPFRVEGTRVTFRINVKPRASADRLRLDNTGRLRLEIRALPADGEANTAIIKFFARQLKVPQDSVEIAMGGKSRQKLIRILGHPPYTITDKLMALACEN